jgi:hypothetical protein
VCGYGLIEDQIANISAEKFLKMPTISGEDDSQRLCDESVLYQGLVEAQTFYSIETVAVSLP